MQDLAESGEMRNLVFFDEKPFVIQQFVNKQNENFATSDGRHGDGLGRYIS